MDHPAMPAHGIERRRPLAVPDQVGIAIVLEYRPAVLRGELEHFAASRLAQDRPGRILHGRNRIDVFRLYAAALERCEGVAERIHAHALAVERDADRFDAEPL